MASVDKRPCVEPVTRVLEYHTSQNYTPANRALRTETSHMESDPNRADVRRVFRLLAGASCPFFFIAAILTAFPKIIEENGQPSFLLAALLLWGGVLFATIASTGKLRK